MTINEFSMTKDQYDHIRHLIISTPRNSLNNHHHLFPAIKYLRNISKNKAAMENSKTDGRWYILTVRDCFDIALKIESKL